MKVLDLFSGIGGFSLGLERAGGFETVAFCEIEEFPRKVLRKHWPNVPIFEDVRKLRGEDVGPVDVICGGYPCQPFSTAGQRRGKEDDRHLWPEFNRLVAELRPSWVIGENVAGHISMGLDDVLSDLEGQGYACRTFVIPACAVGAPHRRDRTWVVAHSDSERSQGYGRPKETGSFDGRRTRNLGAKGGGNVSTPDADNNAELRLSRKQCEREKQPLPSKRCTSLANAERFGQSGQGELVIPIDCKTQGKRKADHAFSISKPGKWSVEPNVGRVANGVSRRVDRLRALGNAVVPQIPEMIGRAIMASQRAQ